MNDGDSLIDLLYGAMLGEVHWQSFVESVGRGMPDARTTLFVHDVVRGAGSFAMTAGFQSGEVDAYNHTYAALNPWMPAAALRPVGLGVVADQMLAADALARTAFDADFLRPMGMRSATGVTIERSQGRLFLLSVLTSRPDPAANLFHAQRLTRLAPHLRRAFRHQRRQSDLDLAGRAALDALGVGAIVVGGDLRCRLVSDLAQQLLGAQRGVSCDAAGRLRFADGAIDEALRALLARPGETVNPTHEATLIVPGAATRIVLVRIASEELSLYLQGPTVVVLIDPLTGVHDGGRADLRALAPVAARYGLSQSEIAVAQGLAGGLTLNEIARQRDVSRETVKSQLGSIFAKTGTKRQAELIRLMLAGSTGA